ncbi:MAG: hypothetical protein V4466_04575 [Pseudomonadota bacterium]
MRLPAFLATTLLAASAAVAAQAAPLGGITSINIIVGPELQDKAKDYGVREFDTLTSRLLHSVERELRKTDSLVDDGGRLDLVIEDAKPNRPTMKQMSATPGLSFESRGIGGAKVTGVLTTAAGDTVPVSYSWYESDFRNPVASGTWSDAETSFDRFARQLVRGEAIASR